MKKPLRLHTFQVGTPPKRGEGLRIATTRHPPRGIPRERWRQEARFDCWLSVLAPSRELLARTPRERFDEAAVRQRFFAAYEREMQQTEPRQAIALLAALAQRTPISVGCFCSDESRCTRSRLKRLIEKAAVVD